jgi:hypothetical protein
MCLCCNETKGNSQEIDMASASSMARHLGLAFTVALGVLGCGGGGGGETSEPAPIATAPVPTSQASTISFALAAARPAPIQPPTAGATLVEGRLDTSSQKGDMDFHYDAYVVTALRSGTVGVTSTVTEGRYALGYGFPISMGLIRDGADLRAYGGNYEQNALNTGVAVTRYTVEKDQQYILVYKTFGSFMPLQYTLDVGEALRVEGRIAKDAEKAEASTDPGGLISLDNPRPRALSQLMQQISPVVQLTR